MTNNLNLGTVPVILDQSASHNITITESHVVVGDTLWGGGGGTVTIGGVISGGGGYNLTGVPAGNAVGTNLPVVNFAGGNANYRGMIALTNANTFTENVLLNGGAVLSLQNSSALGVSTNTVTLSGGVLLLQGGISIANTILNSQGGPSGYTGGIISEGPNSTTTNTLTGQIIDYPVTANNSSYFLASDTGTLLLNNANPFAGSISAALDLSGAGNGSITGTINLGTTGSNFYKFGSGQWSLSGTWINGTAEQTYVDNGTLYLDYSTNNTNKISSNSALNLNGGTLTLNGNASAYTQVVNGINVNAGYNTIGSSGGSINLSGQALTIRPGRRSTSPRRTPFRLPRRTAPRASSMGSPMAAPTGPR